MSIVVARKGNKIYSIGKGVSHNAPPKYLGFCPRRDVLWCDKNIVGHPFDTIKVRRLQTASDGRFKGPMDCVFQTVSRNEGLRGFYKGFTPPLVGWVLMDSVMLGSLHVYRRVVKDNLFPEEKKLPILRTCDSRVGKWMDCVICRAHN